MVVPYRKSQVPDSYKTLNSAKMSFPASDSITKAPVASCGGGDGSAEAVDDHSRKIRKPYTITKSRESWTELEHDKFLEALHLFDRDWKKIEAFVGSKSAIQIRSHAQKYFLKVQKNGRNEHVPPPRPKRKAAHPYPHKAPKIAATKVREPFQSSADFLQPAVVIEQDSLNLRNQVGTADLSSWTGSAIQQFGVPYFMPDNMGLSGTVMSCNCCSSSAESNARACPNSEANNHGHTGRVIPDFAQVYRFIGDIFDPNASDHLQKLKTMDPVDVETALLLMKNLCANLTSPKLEDHRRLLSSYNVVTEHTSHSSSFSNLHAVTSRNAIRSS